MISFHLNLTTVLHSHSGTLTHFFELKVLVLWYSLIFAQPAVEHKFVMALLAIVRHVFVEQSDSNGLAFSVLCVLCMTAATAVAHLSHHNSVCPYICLSVTRVVRSKMVQARITKFSLSVAWKTLVSGSVKLFHKFERVTPSESAE